MQTCAKLCFATDQVTVFRSVFPSSSAEGLRLMQKNKRAKKRRKRQKCVPFCKLVFIAVLRLDVALCSLKVHPLCVAVLRVDVALCSLRSALCV